MRRVSGNSIAKVAGAVAILLVLATVLISLPGPPGEGPPAGPGRNAEDARPDVARDGGPVSGVLPGGEATAEPPPEPRPATGASVHGRVLDVKTRRPVAQVRVSLTVQSRTFHDLRTVSDREGRYRFDDVPPGVPLWARVEHSMRGKPAVGFTPDRVRILGDGESLEQDVLVRRRPGVEVTYRMEVPEGTPMPAHVTVTHTAWTGGNPIDAPRSSRPLDPEAPTVTLYLPKGANLIGFAAPGLHAALPRRDVAGDGSPERDVVRLEPRKGILVRVVDEDGSRVLRKGLSVTVLAIRISPVGTGSEPLGTRETDARGEADVTELVPPPNLTGTDVVSRAYGFALRGEGLFRAPRWLPTVSVSVKDVLRMQAQSGTAVIEVPARRWLPVTVKVTDPGGAPVSGVRVTCLPASSFPEGEPVTDARGEVTVRLLTAESILFGGHRLVAGPPWLGELDLAEALVSGLRPSARKGGGPFALIVRKAVRVRLRLLNDLGEVLIGTQVELDGKTFATDARGAVELRVVAESPVVTVEASGHLRSMKEVDLGGKETEISLDRARKLAVSVRRPTELGSRALIDIVATEPDRPGNFGTSRYRDEGGVLTCSIRVPHRTVKVIARSSDGKWRGEATADPNVESVEIRLSPR